MIPKAPFPYAREKTTYKAGEITVGGVLFTPEKDGIYPAVVLLDGSGARSSDPEVPGKPCADVWLWVLADHLARAGIATISLDSRGVGNSTGRYDTATIFDLAADAKAAVEFLRTRPKIDRDRVGFIGLSEGGTVASIAAPQLSKLAFVVLLTPPAIAYDQVFVSQRKALDIVSKKGADEIARGLEFNQRLVELAKSEMSPTEILKEMNQLETRPGHQPYCARPELVQTHVQTVTQSVFRSLLRADPGAAFQQLKTPVLAIYGEKDFKIAADPNLPALKNSLAEAVNSDATVKLWPDLSHTLVKTRNGFDADSDNTIDPDVLDFITSWILKRTEQAARSAAQ